MLMLECSLRVSDIPDPDSGEAALCDECCIQDSWKLMNGITNMVCTI